jgi:hypothetical protein
LDLSRYWQNILQTDKINHNLSITGGHQHVEKEFYGVVGAVRTFWIAQSSCRQQYHEGAQWAKELVAR